MATGTGIEGVEGPIRRLFGDGSASGMDASELLRRFATGRDPVALEVIVARHGPMVLGVCRRVLGDRHSSDDAFQATFLILAKKAGAIRDPDRLGPWLHGVAHRVAVRARADLARRMARERPGAEDLAMATPADEAGFDRLELRAALDEEIRKLPDKFRDPIVLCYLDGLTHDEAASRLRCPVGTIRSRLSTGRARLRDRLTRRGVAVPMGVFATALAAEAAPVSVSLPLLTSTVKAATAFAAGLTGATAAGLIPAAVASLAEGVSTTMILSKLKIVAGLALSGMLTVGLGSVAAYQAGGPGQEPKDEKAEKPAVEPDQKSRNARIMETAAEIGRLHEERDRIDLELVAAQKRLTALMTPDNPTGLLQGPKVSPSLEAVIQSQVKQAEAERLRAELTRVQAELKVAKTQLEAPESTVAKKQVQVYGFTDAPAKSIETRKVANAPVGGGMASGMGGMGGPVDPRVLGRGLAFGSMGEAASKTMATLQGNDYVIVHKPGSNKVAGYSTEAGEWASYEVPKGVAVEPVGGQGVITLYATGDEIGQLAAFVPTTGRWYPIDLKEPARGKATPLIGPGQAVFAIGRRVYAFSASTKSWDVLELPEGAKPTPYIFPARTTVEHDDHIYIFSGKTGKWADFDAGAAGPKPN